MELFYDSLTFNQQTFLIAITKNGLAFVGSPDLGIDELKKYYPEADLSLNCQRVAPFKSEINAFLLGKRTNFDFKIDDSAGSPLQQLVWRTLRTIPYGETIDYSTLAQKVGKPTAIRAVASALAKNPSLIVTPCHRVIRKGGAIGQYRGGVPMKINLQHLEQIHHKTLL